MARGKAPWAPPLLLSSSGIASPHSALTLESCIPTPVVICLRNRSSWSCTSILAGVDYLRASRTCLPGALNPCCG
jgi:hypothetical protein